MITDIGNLFHNSNICYLFRNLWEKLSKKEKKKPSCDIFERLSATNT
jgi:hypothetical protein